MDNFGQSICVRAGAPAVNAVDVDKVNTEFARRYATNQKDAKKRGDAQRKAFERSMDKLSAEYPTWVSGDTEWIWKTEKPA